MIKTFEIWNFGHWNLFEIWNLGFQFPIIQNPITPIHHPKSDVGS